MSRTIAAEQVSAPDRLGPSTSPTPGGTSTRPGSAARPSIAVATGRDTAAELREACADVVLPDLSDTAEVTAAIDRLTRVRPAASLPSWPGASRPLALRADIGAPLLTLAGTGNVGQ